MNNKKQNPYVGPRTFRTDERELFFGRERETLDLLSLVISERLVLFYAQSGAGKSSLINAKLIPGLLAEEDYRVLPVGRQAGGDSLSGIDIDNIYIYNLINSLAQHDIRTDILSRLTLTKFLAGLGIDLNRGLKQVLIIDQFEELFSIHQEAWEKREDFFRQLARAMQNYPNLWVVLVMREDYIAYLDPYVHFLPGKLRVRYYMQRLGHEAAIEAVKRPAAKAKRPFAKGIAEKLVSDLSSVKVRKPDDTLETQIGQYVEPVQLQVVCSSLWEKLPANFVKITQEHLDQYVGDVNQALGNYYNERVKTVAEGEEAKKRDVKERAIREWFGRKLITADGIRNLVAQEPGSTSGGLDDEVIQEFVKTGDLVRAETRGSVTFYELTHDRLIEPIIADNRKWEEAHTSVLQRQALLWDQQGRSEGLLLRGQDLANIEKDISTTNLTKIEQGFLSACRKLKAQEEREHRQKRLVTVFSIVTTMAFILALFFGIQSVQERDRAQNLAQVGLAHQLVVQSKGQLNNLYDLSLLLGIEAYRLRKDLPEARSNLLANLNSPNLIKFLSPHKNGTVRSLAFSPNDQILASGSDDDTIVLWDVSNPQSPVQLGAPLEVNAEGVESLAFSPDGNTLASGSWQEIILWDISDPASPTQLSEPLSGHTRYVVDMAFSPDGNTLASSSVDQTIILWDVSNLQSPMQIGAPLAVHEDNVKSIAFSPNGLVLASGSWDHTIILWDVSNLQSPTQIGAPLEVHTNDVESVAFSPDGKTLASGSEDNTIILWDVSNLQSPVLPLGEPLVGHTSWVQDLAFSSDGKTLASGSADKTIRLWDISDPISPKQVGAPLAGHTSLVEDIAFSSDGKTLASGGDDKTIRLWAVLDPQAPNQVGTPLSAHTGDVKGVAFSPDGKTLASGGDDSIILWNVSNPQSPTQIGVPLPLLTEDKGFESIAFSPDGKILAAGSEDYTIALWDLSNLQVPTRIGASLSAHEGNVQSVAFSPDGKMLASGSEDDTIILWDISNLHSPAPLGAPLDAHTDDVQAIAFSPDGKTLASGSDDDTIILWDISNPQSPTPHGDRLSAHTDDVKSVPFSPDGKTLASGSDDDTVILWNVSDLKSPFQIGAPLAAHTRSVESVAFSLDGKLLASSGDDETIILWDVSNPELPTQLGMPIVAHTNSVRGIAFSPDGKILATGSDDFTVRLWDIDADSWLKRTCALVGRNLTEDEWEKYLPGEQYLETCPSQTTLTTPPASISPTPTAFAPPQATLTPKKSLTASPVAQVFPTTGIPATSLPPLLLGEVTTCDPSRLSINFRMVESPPDLTDKNLEVQIADQAASCFVNSVNPSLLTCTITDYVTFPVIVVVRLDGAVVNEFIFSGLGCDLEATPIP